MVLDSVLPLQAAKLDKLDRFTRLNVLALLGQSIRESKRGNPERAVLYFVTALVALKSMKLSFAIQGVLTVDRIVGGLTGSRPLDNMLTGSSRKPRQRA